MRQPPRGAVRRILLDPAPAAAAGRRMTWLLVVLATLLRLPLPGLMPAPLPGEAGAEGGIVIPLAPAIEGERDDSLPAVTPARGTDPPLVVIDPGHGGRDPGASSPEGELREKDVTLALARAMRDSLARSGRVRAALTRDGDSYLPLAERYAIARRLGADLFISVHADAAPANDQARGATLYTLSEVASDRQAALLAARENEADLIGGARLSPDANVNLILIDLAQRESMNVSADFARLLYREA